MTETSDIISGKEPPVVSVAELDADPHAVLRSYREHTPIIRREDGAFLVLRASDVLALVRDHRTRQIETELIELRGVKEGPLHEFFKHTMLFSNGSDHTRRRSPMTRAFAFRMMEEMRPRIRALADELLARCHAEGNMSFLEQYAAAIPSRTIAAILGIPSEDIPRFTRSVYAVAKALSGSWRPADVPEIDKAVSDLKNYVSDLLDDRRRNPRDEFLSHYIEAVERQGELSPLEAVIQIITVVLGGSDTTRGAMAIQMALLLQHPQQWEALCRDPTLVSNAASEALRYEPSVASYPRFTLEAIDIDGRQLPAHRPIVLSTMSAMRDDELYSDPDKFDILRSHPRWHPVFGGGPHRCLGEQLARAELEEGLSAIVAQIPQLRLVSDPPKITGHAGIRQVSEFHVGWA